MRREEEAPRRVRGTREDVHSINAQNSVAECPQINWKQRQKLYSAGSCPRGPLNVVSVFKLAGFFQQRPEVLVFSVFQPRFPTVKTLFLRDSRRDGLFPPCLTMLLHASPVTSHLARACVNSVSCVCVCGASIGFTQIWCIFCCSTGDTGTHLSPG